jgi:hypothetical protein
MSRLVPAAAAVLVLVLALATAARAEPPAADKPGAAAGVGAPKIAASLVPSSSTYKGEMTGGGQADSVSATQTVRLADGNWIIEAVNDSPLGVVTETAVLDAKTGVVRRRTVKDGPMVLDLTFAGGQAKGTLSIANRAPAPVAVDTGGEIFGDGAGGYDALALLPLSEGYKASYRTLDELMQKAVTRQIAVVGSEEVKVPAGSFITWKAEISSEDLPGRITLWVAKDSRKVVKSLLTQPWMGGMRVTLELQR